MDIEEIIKIPGIKLVDTNVFLPGRFNLLSRIYDAKQPEDISIEDLEIEISSIREGMNYFKSDGVFTIKEVGDEIYMAVDKINSQISYHKSKIMSSNKKPGREGIKRKKVFNKRKDGEELEEDPINAKVVIDNLNLIARGIIGLKRKIDGRDIRNKFSKTQSEMYERFLEYFIFISTDPKVQKGYSAERDHLINRTPCNFQTAQKLLATAFTISQKENVLLVSSNSTIQKSIHFFHKGRQRGKQLPSPVYTLSPYSNFGDGFKFQRTK